MSVRRRKWSDTEHDHNRCSHWPVIAGDFRPDNGRRIYEPDEIVETKRRTGRDYCNECKSKHKRGVPEVEE